MKNYIINFIIFYVGIHFGSAWSEPTSLKIVKSDWYRPQILTTWHWQLQGKINIEHDVELFNIDLEDTSKDLIEAFHRSGKKVICYFSAGSYEDWRDDAKLFSDTDIGKPMAGWSNERWLDIRSEKVHKIIENRLDVAKSKNCDGVEPDNVDGYMNDTGFDLLASDQIAFNLFIARMAHERGLAVGLKNNLDQVLELVNDFDFAVNEQCFEFSECAVLKAFTAQQKPVFHVEYQEKYGLEKNRDILCQKAEKMKFSTLILPIELDDRFRISCRYQ